MSVNAVNYSYTESTLNYAFSNFDKCSLKGKVAKVALATLILTPGIGLLALAPGALLDVVNFVTVEEKSPNKSQEENNSFRKFDSKEDGIDYEIGKRESSPWISGRFTSWIINHTLMRGVVTVNWKESRIKKGKLKDFALIGADSLFLNTRHGDKLHACYFDALKFDKKLEGSGVKFATISFNHAFFKDVTPVWMLNNDGDKVDGLEISSQAATNDEFREFCCDMGYTILSKSGEKKLQYILVNTFSNIKGEGYLENTTIHPASHLDNSFFIFGGIQKEKSFLFNHNPSTDTENIDQLGDKARTTFFIAERLLSDGKMVKVKYKGKFIITSRKVASLLSKINANCNKEYSFLNLSEHKPVRELRGQTVVLTTHQTGSFLATAQEILEFLFLGMNVFAYDNAGKGLSKGMNTQETMNTAINTAGWFLKEQKKIAEESITFKGTCIGGVATSEASKMFPRATVWLNDAPQNCLDFVDFPILKNFIRKLTSWVFPDSDTLENLKKGSGKRIYSIAKTDTVIPKNHQESFKARVPLLKNGHYIKMPGGKHVNANWWEYPEVVNKLKGILAPPNNS